MRRSFSLGGSRISGSRLRRLLLCVAAVASLALISGCGSSKPEYTGANMPGSEITTDAGTSARFAIVGDFGSCDSGEKTVANMITAWNVFIVSTTGDNTLGTANCAPYTQSVATFYGAFVQGADGPAFYPVPGERDYDSKGAGLSTYLNYFAYAYPDINNPWYTIKSGDVNLYMLDSQLTGAKLAEQKAWLRKTLADAKDQQLGNWNVVVFHRPPISSATGSADSAMSTAAGWDYKAWGADAVINGHVGFLEQLRSGGLTYLTAGSGSTAGVQTCPVTRLPESAFCSAGTGALLVTASDTRLQFQYRSPNGGSGKVIHTTVITR